MAKFYAVRKGNKPGIYRTWDECKEQIHKFKGAEYKSFTSERDALNYINENKLVLESNSVSQFGYIETSLSTDAACSGNPGELEFRGVDTQTGKQIFHYGPFPLGTNNLGEFLGIVHGLQILNSNQEWDKPIYADSQTAIAWVKKKNVNTNLVRNHKTEELWQMIDAAIEWLERNDYRNPILKWDTVAWGEIKADFGRK